MKPFDWMNKCPHAQQTVEYQYDDWFLTKKERSKNLFFCEFDSSRLPCSTPCDHFDWRICRCNPKWEDSQ